MELSELGVEYLKRSDVLLDRISQLKKQLVTLDRNDKISVKRRIAMLTVDAEHCRRCACILINYRRRDE